MDKVDIITTSMEDKEKVRNLLKEKLKKEKEAELEQDTMEKVFVDDTFLSKFIRHVAEEKGDPAELAANMILKSARWRKEFKAADIKSTDVSDSLLNKGVLSCRNRDKDGKKMVILSVEKHVKGVEKKEDMKKFYIYLLERLAREGEDQFTLVFDCKSAGLKNLDLEFVQFIVDVLKDFYPDPLNHILVFDMPWILNAAFQIIKSWLPKAGVRKIQFVTKTIFSDYVDDDNKLEAWGGNSGEYKWEPEA